MIHNWFVLDADIFFFISDGKEHQHSIKEYWWYGNRDSFSQSIITAIDANRMTIQTKIKLENKRFMQFPNSN